MSRTASDDPVQAMPVAHDDSGTTSANTKRDTAVIKARGFFGRIVGRQKETAERDTMLNYFLSVLDVRIKSIAPQISTASDAAAKIAIHNEIAAKLPDVRKIVDPLDADAAWTEAYRLERMVALIEPAVNLAAEAQRRVDEAVEEHIPSAPRLQTRLNETLKKVADPGKTPAENTSQVEALLRPLLLDILEEIHWCYQRKFTMRPIQLSACHRILFAAFIVFLLIIAPYVRIYWYIYAIHKPVSFLSWSWLPLYTVLTGIITLT